MSTIKIILAALTLGRYTYKIILGALTLDQYTCIAYETPHSNCTTVAVKV